MNPFEAERISKVGRLDVLNGHHALGGHLWEADGTKWICRFGVSHRHILARAWLKTVRVTGRVVTENRTSVLRVESLVIEDENLPEQEGDDEMPFWKPLSLAELAERQGIQPVDDLDSISALWPMDDDPEDLLAHVLMERDQRRRAVRIKEIA
jgi:hypothetical protein